MVGETLGVSHVGTELQTTGTPPPAQLPLMRHRSADDLLFSFAHSAHSVPPLDDLAESEVFVGEEGDEEEDLALVGAVGDGEEIHMTDLLSHISPSPSSLVTISYHDELRLPLDAVKEEVEAEAAEEASMNFSSYGPSSLSSSVVSSNSLDGSASSRTDTQDTVLMVSSPDHVPGASQTASSSVDGGNNKATGARNGSAQNTPTSRGSVTPRSSRTDIVNKSAKMLKNHLPPKEGRLNQSPAHGGVSRKSPRSPHTAPDAARTPERRRKVTSLSPRETSSRVTSASPKETLSGNNSQVSTPRGVAFGCSTTSRAASSEDKKVQMANDATKSKAVGDKKLQKVKKMTKLAGSDKQASSFARETASSKAKEASPVDSLLNKKVKHDAKDIKAAADKFGTLGRKKKEKNEKEEVIDRYGSLGRRRKAKEAETKEETRSLSKECKDTLDTYATLPRRRAKEVSARWKEQHLSEEDPKQSPHHSQSVGKGDGIACATAARSSLRLAGGMGSSLPPLSQLSSHTVHSPRPTRKHVKVPSSGRKERTIICLETAVQTSLTGGDIASVLHAASRQNSSNSEADVDLAGGKIKPHVQIIREFQKPDRLCNQQDEGIQVEVNWRGNEGELMNHLQQLGGEHEKLKNEHAKMCCRVIELEESVKLAEKLQNEIENLQKSITEERAGKVEVQEELEQTSRRIRDMLTSMEGVETEFNNRGDSLIELEQQLQNSAEVNIKMQEKLDQYEECVLKLRKDLDKSMAAQKTLLQQFQDLEAEGREMAEFMSEEKNALTECLREAESELSRAKSEHGKVLEMLSQKDEEARCMVRLAEERRNEYLLLQSEMNVLQNRARDMMVCQGAEVSGASVALANLTARLETLINRLIQDYSITETDLEMIVTPTESDSSASSASGTPEHRSPMKVANRTPSPRKSTSFVHAVLNAMRGGPKSSKILLLGLGNKENKINIKENKHQIEGRNSPEGSECQGAVETNGGSLEDGCSSANSVSLVDQVMEVDILLSRFLKVCCVLKNDSDNILTEIEDENERLCSQMQSQNQVIAQQQLDCESLNRSESRIRRELMVATKDLDLANQNLSRFYEADYESKIKKLEDELERVGSTLRHIEALHSEKEGQLKESLAALAAAQGPAPPLFIAEADYRQEVAQLGDKVASLRQSVIERDRRITELSERHSQDLDAVRDAQLSAQRATRRLTGSIEQVLKTLESIPDVVSSCPTLKQLFTALATTEKSQYQSQGTVGNGRMQSISKQNGCANSLSNKDLNANPSSALLSPNSNGAGENIPALPLLRTETHL